MVFKAFYLFMLLMMDETVLVSVTKIIYVTSDFQKVSIVFIFKSTFDGLECPIDVMHDLTRVGE